ncbi:MAG: hypothetical protein LBL51_03840, partial [Synergistaceae bacterium]|nr:hypothetical protein [Synergistaceae bacterium]
MRGRREPGAKGPDASAAEALTAWPYRLGLSFYRLGISAFFAGGGLCWLRKKYKTGLEQRVGNISGVPKGALWVHAVSVGEVQSALPLVGEAEKRLPCVLSTVTATGRGMAERLMPGTPMIYNPWDVPRFVSRALDALSPRAYAAMETERWPALLAELRARGIPAFLVNGRLSEGSARRLSGQRAFWRGVLCCFEKLLVRFESDRERFLGLGVPEGKIAVTGDCKVDAMFARKAGTDAGKWSRLRRGNAPLFLAGSTHPGEDEIVLEAFRRVRERHPRVRLVVAPRHPERAASVAELARSGLARSRVSPLSDAAGDWDVSVVDRVGVLFELYPAADAAF